MAGGGNTREQFTRRHREHRRVGVGIKFEGGVAHVCARGIAGFARKFIRRGASGVGSFFARR